MVKVKICGITNWTDARRAVESGADFLGFNFYRASSRYIEPAKARSIVRKLPKRVITVGVFVNAGEAEIRRIARNVGLQRLQLHGDEPPEFVRRLHRILPVIKALRVQKPFRLAEVKRFDQAHAILLDGFDSRTPGGTGKTFDWKIGKRASSGRRIFLAGGLTPENVGAAIRAVHPYAVDVCSGVESVPGKKDPALVKALIAAVHQNQE
jgi:phosphoribosylanthranilate isomerase